MANNFAHPTRPAGIDRIKIRLATNAYGAIYCSLLWLERTDFREGVAVSEILYAPPPSQVS
ncbi:MAG TPA: hypothetical protein VER76_15130 [Pyrinomonadaceae bacterium]|nr:hypothetical protein [Pyrinomonadaceae bacterium]